MELEQLAELYGEDGMRADPAVLQFGLATVDNVTLSSTDPDTTVQWTEGSVMTTVGEVDTTAATETIETIEITETTIVVDTTEVGGRFC